MSIAIYERLHETITVRDVLSMAVTGFREMCTSFDFSGQPK
jgi:hypothetical protein